MTLARRLLLPLAALLPLLVSCGGSSGTGLVDSLVGHRFAAVSAVGIDLPQGTSLGISFDEPGDEPGADGRLGVSGGCNLIGGGYALDDRDTLRAVGGWIQTEMACDEPRMVLDAAVVALLDSSPVLSLEGTTLTITSGGTRLTLEQE